jgi:endoglucanase
MTYTRLLMQLCILMLMLIGNKSLSADTEASICSWPLYEAYVQRHMQADGRVIDFQIAPGITTSEGQAYTLFFALVANDRKRFDQILQWTSNNLSAGNLNTRLPAWLWGKREDGTWGVTDKNTASDANLWLAYTLIEASRLWNAPAYLTSAKAILKQIVRHEVTTIPDVGKMLMPGVDGFHPSPDLWIFNPSYLPLQLLRRLEQFDNRGPWKEISKNTVIMMQNGSKFGFAPDWIRYHRNSGWGYDQQKGDIGSYDAIRVYLWAGMLDDADPAKSQLMLANSGMYHWLVNHRDVPPEKVSVSTGEATGRGPAGFSAALMPYLHAFNKPKLIEAQKARIKRKSKDIFLGEYEHYYDQVLGLFGMGWMDGKYRFDHHGKLMPSWKSSC